MFQTLEENPWIMGEFAWCTFDYLGEPFPHAFPNRSSCFALYDLAGLPKDRAYLYKAQWKQREMPEVLHLLPHWNWSEGMKIPVHAFTSCASGELFVNGRSLGKRFTTKSSPRLIWEDVPFEEGKLEITGYDAEGRERARSCRVTSSSPAAIGIHCEEEICRDGSSYIFAELYLKDQQGNVIETADSLLEFALHNGTLIGVDNGDARSLLPFKRNYTPLYNGHAMVTAHFAEDGEILVRFGDLEGKCVIKVAGRNKR